MCIKLCSRNIELYNNYFVFFIVPPVIVSISQDRSGILYAGTSFFFKCDIIVSSSVTIPFTVTNQWTRNDANVPMGPSDDTITAELNMINRLNYNATLTFYPLDDDDDSGVYTCNVEVTAPSNYKYLRNTSASASTSINVTGSIATAYYMFNFVHRSMCMCIMYVQYVSIKWLLKPFLLL